MTNLVLHGGEVLAPGGASVARADVVVAAGIIESIGPGGIDGAGAGADTRLLDATGAWVLPGIVDVHGDAFERSLMPRAGVSVDVSDGLADNDTHLLAAGITTAYLSATDSWEPGLRSRNTLRSLIEANDRTPGFVDRRVHVRHERCNTEDFDELLDWVLSDRVQMISYNDHTPGGISLVGSGVTQTQVARSGLSEPELLKLQDEAIARRDLGADQERRLAEVCRAARCPTASHDADSADDLSRDRALGVAIAEFPTSLDLATRYLEAGIEVALGAPNLVRGGSHLGNLSVRDAVAGSGASLLCSDYHYPSLLRSPFVLSDLGLRSFGEAWAMVSTSPAASAGLDDRGRVAPGLRADLVVVEPPVAGGSPRVRTVVCGGRIAFHSETL